MLSRFEFISSLPVKVRPFFALLLVKWILHYQWVLPNVSKLQIYNYQQVWRLTNSNCFAACGGSVSYFER